MEQQQQHQRPRSRSGSRTNRVRMVRGRSGSRSVSPQQHVHPDFQRQMANRARERGEEDLRNSLNRHHKAKTEVSMNMNIIILLSHRSLVLIVI
jgi:hypothetical protein